LAEKTTQWGVATVANRQRGKGNSPPLKFLGPNAKKSRNRARGGEQRKKEEEGVPREAPAP